MRQLQQQLQRSEKVKVLNGQLICTDHNNPIEMIRLDRKIDFSETMLCKTCFDTKISMLNQTLNIRQAENFLNDNIEKNSKQFEEKREQQIKQINQFKNKMNNLKSELWIQFDQIESVISDLIFDTRQLGKISNKSTLLEKMEYFYYQQEKDQQNFNKIRQNNNSYLEKIEKSVEQLLLICRNGQQQFSNLKVEIDIQNNPYQENQDNQYTSKFKKINEIVENNKVYSIALNNSGTQIVVGQDKKIEIWEFHDLKFQLMTTLSAHNNQVTCLAYSKLKHQFVSGCSDSTIKCWQEIGKSTVGSFYQYNWKKSEEYLDHNLQINCLILNSKEEEMISCSSDKKIIVWDAFLDNVQLQKKYTLEQKHTDCVFCLSYNQSESLLVSCGKDRLIILWERNYNNEWKYLNSIKANDYEHRVCFVNESLIAWAQYNQEILNIFQISNKVLLDKPVQLIKLQQSSTANDINLFPPVINKEKQICIFNHSNFVYILKIHLDGLIKIAQEPINCNHSACSGSLSNNGQILLLCSPEMKSLSIYKE